VVKYAQIRSEFQAGGLTWLGIEDKSAAREGVFVFLYEDVTQPCRYDWWFQTIEEALQFAEDNYGVRPHEWETADDLRARGIETAEAK
jgi:hypothetical protein